MRTFFRSGRFYADLTGLALSAMAFFASTKAPDPLPDVLGGVGSSVVFAVGLDLLIALQGYLFHRRQQLMFGRDLVRGGALFAYPDFIMNEDVATTLAQSNQQMLYRRPRSRYATKITHRIDIPRVVAANDIRALLHVSDIFRANATTTQMIVDREILDSAERSFMSFGLSSNDCTHLYLDVDRNPLFSIVPDGAGSEFLRIDCDGSEFRSSDSVQYGLIVRYSPDIDLAPDRRWFLVAGLGPLGTTSAAKFVARRWEQLLKSVGPRDDFVVIVSTGVGSDDYPRLEAIYRRSRSTGSCERIAL